MVAAPRKYRYERDSVHEHFHASRGKIQMMGGGYGNGKTAALCIKTMVVAKEYPGANILLARSTYPKLQDTLMKEFFLWLPKRWIDKFSKTPNPTLLLKNGTTINFRYIAQQGSSDEDTTSNLLSATYDFIGIDQVDDSDITHKDFLDLMGRLRGNTPYVGEDITMPGTGPRWMVITCNPTRNWVYRTIVKPLQEYKKGVRSAELIADEQGKPLVELYEGPTYINRLNLSDDYINAQEALYKGQMRDRYLLGLWAGYEGLVYPSFDFDKHIIEHAALERYYWHLCRNGYRIKYLEGYDYGLAVPACYIFAFMDPYSNIFMIDGHYAAEAAPVTFAQRIRDIRNKYSVDMFADLSDYDYTIRADPDCFRRKPGGRTTVGQTIAGIFAEDGIDMSRGNNDISAGVLKVRALLEPIAVHRNPITGNYGAPHLYMSNQLNWWIAEATDYYWAKDTKGEPTDKPRDKNDHAMDTTRYLLTSIPDPPQVELQKPRIQPDLLRWTEQDAPQGNRDNRARRYA